VLGSAEVLDEATVAAHQHEGRDPVLDSCEQATHRSAVADAQVRDPVVVDICSRAEQVNRAAQIDDQLDLLGAGHDQ
jgi:hypothetical protein